MKCFWCSTYPKRPGTPVYDPCVPCELSWKEKVILIEVLLEPKEIGQIPVVLPGGKMVFPTGTWATVSHERAVQLWGDTLGEAMSENGKVFLTPETWMEMVFHKETR